MLLTKSISFGTKIDFIFYRQKNKEITQKVKHYLEVNLENVLIITKYNYMKYFRDNT